MKTMKPQPTYMMRCPFQPKLFEMRVPPSIHEDVPEHYEAAYMVDLGYEGEDSPMVVAVKYIPAAKSENGGFAVIYLMEKELGNGGNLIPCRMMRAVWSRAGREPRNFMNTYILDSTGKVFGKDGCMPSDEEISDCAYVMLRYYERWYRFPFESDWDTVCELCQAQDKVANLNREICSHKLKDEVERARETIADLRRRISAMEEELNGLYEDAADGLNFLEEHGYTMEIAEAAPQGEVDHPF